MHTAVGRGLDGGYLSPEISGPPAPLPVQIELASTRMPCDFGGDDNPDADGARPRFLIAAPDLAYDTVGKEGTMWNQSRLGRALSQIVVGLTILQTLLLAACGESGLGPPGSQATTSVRLQLHIDALPTEVEKLRAALFIDGKQIAPMHEGPSSERRWEEEIDPTLQGMLELHVDGEQLPQLVRAEGTQMLELRGRQGPQTVSVGVELARKEACDGPWCWLSPLPAASTFNSVWAFADDDIWAVGDRGLFMRWDGRAWRLMPPSPLGTGAIIDIWAFSHSDVWLFDGYRTQAARWNGTAWTDAVAPPFPIRKAWGFADGTMWVVGRAGKVARYAGGSWSIVPTGTTDDLSGVWGGDINNLFVVGDRGTVLRWNGTAFLIETQGLYPELFAVWGDAASGDVWATGRSGVLIRRSSGSWSAAASPTTAWLYGFVGRSSSDLWAFGEQGAVVHWNGSAWTLRSVPIQGTLRTATVSSTGDLWLAGTGGTLVSGSVAATWKVITGGMPHFNDIWGSSETDLWIVGMGGAMYHFDGIRLSPVTTGFHHDLHAIWGSGPNDIWAVGWAGPKLHFDGVRWSATSANPDYLFTVWGSGTSDVWAAGDASGIAQHWDGARWVDVDTGVRTYLYNVWGSDSSHIWTTGYGGACAKWDGAKWNKEVLPVTSGEIYSGIFGSSDHDVWIATPLYDMLHWDGVAWRVLGNGGVSGFRALWGSSEQDIWAVGNYGVTAHYAANPPSSAASWRVTYNGTASYRSGALRRIFGLDNKHIWAIGDDGTVLQFRP